jgi:hypothetical protein
MTGRMQIEIATPPFGRLAMTEELIATPACGGLESMGIDF